MVIVWANGQRVWCFLDEGHVQEAVKLYGYVAAVHGDRFLPHVPKVVTNIIKRFKVQHDPCSHPVSWYLLV